MATSRFLLPAGDRARLWDVVARERRLLGDRDGAEMAAWQARSIRSQFPVRRPKQ